MLEVRNGSQPRREKLVTSANVNALRLNEGGRKPVRQLSSNISRIFACHVCKFAPECGQITLKTQSTLAKLRFASFGCVISHRHVDSSDGLGHTIVTLVSTLDFFFSRAPCREHCPSHNKTGLSLFVFSSYETGERLGSGF